MKIKNLYVGKGGWLAPMAGVTDLTFRLLCREMGCALSFTEMISAKGLMLSPPRQRAVLQLQDALPGERVGVQIFGKEPAYMAQAAQQLEASGRYRLLDINMGCPAPKITGGGEGAALLKDIRAASRVIRAVVQAVALPVTVKIRLGWDEESRCHVPFAQMCQAEGAAAVIVHGRTRQQFYSGQADLEAIAQVKQAVSIPVIGNGDIVDAKSALHMVQQTGCDAVMIGRGAQGNPWIFRQLAMAFQGRPCPLPDIGERAHMALRHARMMAAYKGEYVAVREMRKHVAWYLKAAPGCAQLRKQVNDAKSLEEIQGILAPLMVDAEEKSIGQLEPLES